MAAGAENMSDGQENVGRGSAHEEFKEFKEVQGLISSLPDIYQDQVAVETSCERFTVIVDEYQEQPHLIDPHLEALVNQLLSIGRDVRSPAPVKYLAFKFLYLITKMRGAKVVVRLFPHEVVDVEPVLALITEEDPNNHQAWETRYMLLLWLSVACMIPFDLARLDSNVSSESGEIRQPVMDRIMDIGKKYLTAADKSRDAAAYLMSRFMTRPDVKKLRLPEFLAWSMKTLSTADCSVMTGSISLTGELTLLAQLFKNGKREDLLEYAPMVLEHVEALNLSENSNTVLRKYGAKVIQRIGLTFLKFRVAAWRYQRGSRSLVENLQLSKQAILEKQGNKELAPRDEEEEEYDIPEQIEQVIEHLLGALSDKDTVVRWSAAKGIGRITGRLPKELADEVVESLMGLFSLQETEGSWHGGCLALAELGRRGLLLPQRLPDVVPVVLKALAYDERRGSFSVGANVRDAACYVSWAFARAYEPTEIAPYVNRIANALIIATLFDREVNVRKAASAAFQENVGRQGTFPHGIEIVTKADYFAVGNRTHCYLELSLFVAQFPQYTDSLINHLSDVKLAHWDSTIRELAAKALHILTEKSPEHMAKVVLPGLIPRCISTDLYLRHGAILAAAEVTHALSIEAVKQGRCIVEVLGQEVIDGLKSIAQKLSDAKLFRGLGGELMRKAVCCLMQKVSLSKLPFHSDPIIDLWQEISDDCLHHLEPEIQLAAVTAIPAFFTEYYRESDGRAKPQRQDQVIEKYLRELQSSVEVSRKGYAQALGALPKFMVGGKLRAVLSGLTTATQITEKEQKWAEARRDAINAITSLSSTVGVERNGLPSHVLCAANIDAIYDAYLCALKDYTLDSRGDVGAWVREASMTGLHDLTILIVKTDPDLLGPNICGHIFKSLVQQACEKIDRTRGHAGGLLFDLLHHSPPIPHIPDRNDMLEVFKLGFEKWKPDLPEVIMWSAPGQTFPRFTKLLQYPNYTYSVLLGLTVSVGGLTESLVKHSSASLHQYLRSISKDMTEMTRFTQVLTDIFRDHQKVDRVSFPMLKMLDQLLSKGCFDVLVHEESHPFPGEIVSLVKKEISKSGDAHKLMASANVYCGLLQFEGEVRVSCFRSLSILLGHKFPKVRKTTANKLYEVLVTFDDIVPEENLEEIMNILGETIWDNDLAQVKPVRNKLCDLLNIPHPVALKRPDAPAK